MTQPAALEIRELSEQDLDRVTEIEAAANASPWSRALFAGELELTPAERLWVVGSVDNQIVGFAGAMFVGGDVHIMNVAVDLDQRRRGYARVLIAELLRRCIAGGGRHATLEVREGNDPAIALYRRFRLGPVGIRPGYYPDGEDALILWAHDIDTVDYGALLKRLGGRR